MKFSTFTALATLSATFVNAAPVSEAAAPEDIVTRAQDMPFPGSVPATGGDDPWDCGALFCPKEKRQDESVPTMTNNGGNVVPFVPPGKEKREATRDPGNLVPRRKTPHDAGIDLAARDAEANECFEAPDGQIHCYKSKREAFPEAASEANKCWEAPNGQIHCQPQQNDAEARCFEDLDEHILCYKAKRDADAEANQCWEGADGQIHCQPKERDVSKYAPQPRAAALDVTHTPVPGPLAPTPTNNFVTHTLLTGSDALLTPTPVPVAPPTQ